jgi:hypothetical protein
MPPGQRRPYPKTPKREMTPKWKADVRRTLKELGKDDRWLEAEIGASVGSISKMLKQHTSSWVEPVTRVLAIQPPVVMAMEVDRDLAEAVLSASPEIKRAVRAVLSIESKKS